MAKEKIIRKDVKAAEQFIVDLHYGNRRDEDNPKFALQSVNNSVLLMAARGMVDLNAVARLELANRGIGANGVPVKFEDAADAWLYE